jgi:3-dehydrosphinganine reductase
MLSSTLFTYISVIVAILAIIETLISRFYSNNHGSFLVGQNVVITGGSSGIGLSLAKKIIKNNSYQVKSVTLIARNVENLLQAKKQLNDDRVKFLSLDVGNAKAVSESVNKHLRDADVLINAAGLSIPGKLEDLTVEEINHQIQVNLMGSIYITKALLPFMKQRKQKKGEAAAVPSKSILFVSSQAGQIGLYGFSAYSASKFALRGFAEALRMECLPDQIQVSIVYPSDTDTPGLIAENIRKPKITQKISETSSKMTPDDVADIILEGIKNKKFLITVNLDGYFLNLLSLGTVLSSFSVLGFCLEILLFPCVRIFGILNSLYFNYLVLQQA